VKLASVVLFVADIPRSIEYYRELLKFGVSIRNDSAALLVGADGQQVYLRAVGERATHSIGGIGPQYVLWSAASEPEFARCETFLRRQSTHVTTTTVDGFRMVEGRDPDDIPVVISFPGPDELARSEIVARIYDW
jgi:catechol 2,3-dioxygenase-like lactoylglutathione lyase family enzyme